MIWKSVPCIAVMFHVLLFDSYIDGKSECCYYSLTWTFSFPRARDTVYFAHCYPYTYSDLQVSSLLSVWVSGRMSTEFIRGSCRSLKVRGFFFFGFSRPEKSWKEMRSLKVLESQPKSRWKCLDLVFWHTLCPDKKWTIACDSGRSTLIMTLVKLFTQCICHILLLTKKALMMLFSLVDNDGTGVK